MKPPHLLIKISKPLSEASGHVIDRVGKRIRIRLSRISLLVQLKFLTSRKGISFIISPKSSGGNLFKEVIVGVAAV
jgi:hypothetical protein